MSPLAPRATALAMSMFAIVVTLLASACRPRSAERVPAGEAATSADSTPSAAQSGAVPVTRLRAEPYSFSYNSGFTQPARTVIGDSAAWRAAWTQLHARGGPLPALPAVDFARQSVILAALGQRATGGYGIIVESATMARDTLRVTIRSLSPGPRCGTTAALSEPVDLALLPRVARPVAFVERDSVVVCP